MKYLSQLIKTIVLGSFLVISTASANKPLVSLKTMDTSELFERTLDSVEECIEYCIDGISLYAIPTPWGFIYYWTLNVSHNSPDLLMMVHNELDGSPWEAFNDYFGEAYKNITETMMQGVTGLKEVEIGGGRERHAKWGQHQAVALKETTAMGHPAAIILKMFDQGGLKADGYMEGTGDKQTWHQCQTNGCLEEENSDFGNSVRQEYGLGNTQGDSQSASDFLSSFPSGGNTSKGMLSSFGGNKANLNSTANNEQFGDFMSGLGEGVQQNAGDTSNGQRLFCPINVTPFLPYYLSGLDGVQWRMGYPVTDAKYSTYILNPLSADTIGTKVKDEFYLKIDDDTEIKFSLPAISESWGNMFPREGVLNHEWDSKASTVLVARGAHILIEEKSTRVRYKPDDSNNGFGGWGKIFPINGDTTPGQTPAACHKNVANTGITINETGGYAWTFWRRYNCDLRTDGIHIATVKFPEPICLTPEVPE